MEKRIKEKAEKLVDSGSVCWTDRQGVYFVSSQSRQKKYVVINENLIWYCTCPYSQKRKSECKHILAVKIWLKKMPEYRISPTKEFVEEIYCPSCESRNFRKDGKRKTAIGKRQRYSCKDCKMRFVEGAVKNIKGNSDILTKTIALYFGGLSFRKIQEHLYEFDNVKIDASTLYRWFKRFCKIMIEYTEHMHPHTTCIWNADEQIIKAKKQKLYCWNLLDKETRFLIANNVTSGRHIRDARKLFWRAKKATNVRPETIITDGLGSYGKAIRKEMRSYRLPKIKHIPNAGVRKKINNNSIERFNNTFRDRYKTMRRFHNIGTASTFADSFRLHYNFLRPNMALSGLTPAQAAGLEIGFARNKHKELLSKSLNGNDYNGRKPKQRTFVGYKLNVLDQSGKALRKFTMRQFKTEFGDVETAKRFLRFYESIFPQFVFYVEKITS